MKKEMSNTRRTLSTPRAAAIAGILFALLLGTVVVLLRLSVPSDLTASTAWLRNGARMMSLGLNLIPFAGIAFLWFIGVIRDRIGALEDRFFATVFLGSGLLFLAMLFSAAAVAGGLIYLYNQMELQNEVYSFARILIFTIFNVYAIRMGGVFMISLATIWVRTTVMPRWLAFLTYTLALVLLLSISYSSWVTLIFPAWVLVISLYILVMNMRSSGDNLTKKSYADQQSSGS